jgi:hypothetical protein
MKNSRRSTKKDFDALAKVGASIGNGLSGGLLATIEDLLSEEKAIDKQYQDFFDKPENEEASKMDENIWDELKREEAKKASPAVTSTRAKKLVEKVSTEARLPKPASVEITSTRSTEGTGTLPSPTATTVGGGNKKVVSNKRPTFADAVREKTPSKPTVSWADLVEEEIAQSVRKEADQAESLVKVIRTKIGLSQENRVVLPHNLEKQIPELHRRFVLAAEIANCDVIYDSRTEVKPARPVLWEGDTLARNNFLETLYTEKGEPKKELFEIADLGALIDSLLEIPNRESLEKRGPGRTGIWYSVNLVARTFCEQAYDVPIAKQRNWWRIGNNLREGMKVALSAQLGGDNAATTVLTAFDVIYRKFIRVILRQGADDKKNLLSELVTDFSGVLFVTGGGLFNNLLHTQTRVKKVEQEKPVAGGRKTVKEIVEVKYSAKIRPKITEGPRTPFESAIYAKVNNALAKVESQALDYRLDDTNFSSPIEWEEKHATWIEELYSRVRIPSHLMVQRKQSIRAALAAKISSTAGVAGTPSGTTIPSGRAPIAQTEWISQQEALIDASADKFDSESMKALNVMLSSSMNKEELLTVTEEKIISLLGGPVLSE